MSSEGKCFPKASASRRPFSLPAAAGAEGGAAPSPRRRQSRARRAPGAGRDPGHGRDTWTGHPHTRRALACLACLSKKKKPQEEGKLNAGRGGQAPQRVNGAAARRGAFACHYIMQTYIPALTEQVQNMPFAAFGFPPAPRSLTAQSRERSL